MDFLVFSKPKNLILEFFLFCLGMTFNIIKTTGFFSLYNGMSAALLRQGTYSTTRFAFYEYAKEVLVEWEAKKGNNIQKNELPFYQKMIIAGLGGGFGSIVGKLTRQIKKYFN